MFDSNMTEVDKLLVCLALILLLTIVWTIVIGILYKINGKRYYEYKKSLMEDDDDKVIIKSRKKKRTVSKLKTYVKIRFYKSDKKDIFVAPKNIELVEGQKIKVRVNENTLRTAVVVKGNYTREKYKSKEYPVLDIVNK